MGFLDNLKSGIDKVLTAAEERTPNLDDHKPREYSDTELRPRTLKQGDNVLVEHMETKEQITGTVFSNDRRNELVVIIDETGNQGVVNWSDTRFFEAGSANTSTSGKNANTANKIRREDMEDGVIYEGEIIDD